MIPRTPIQHQICSLLFSLGIDFRYAGFYYLMYALELTVYEPERLRYMTKWVYPDVAARFGSTWLAVERSIRHVIVYSWENYPETLKRISDIEILKQPSTSDFMNILTYYLMQKKAA